MAGQLKNHPLTELVREISAADLSGALRLAREPAKSVVYFDVGEIIYAASNLRAYRLSECLRRWNVLGPEQLANLRVETSDLELGAALVESGALSREMLDAVMERQVSELIGHALMWTEGEWDFDSRVRIAREVRVRIRIKKLLIETARRLPSEFIAERLAGGEEKLLPAGATPDDDLALSPTEAFVLTRIDAPISINELLAIGGLPEAETLRAIYTLALGDFVRRERWPQALSAEEIAKARAAKAAPTAEQTSKSAVKVKSEPEVVAQAQPATPAEESRDEAHEPDVLFARLDGATNHYEVLGVRRSASASDIKRAYHALAKRFHPDRFHRGVDAAQLALIESAFAQIAQAYETLKDKGLRAVYDSKLLTEEQARRTQRETLPTGRNKAARQQEAAADPGVSIPRARQQQNAPGSAYQAEERFQQGLSALQQGNHALAIASLGEAARLMPDEPRYRAYFGQALAKDERLRHSAEAEIKAAIALDADNAAFRVMLAALYSEIGLMRRAQAEAERALSIEPQNQAAHQLLAKLKGSGR
jgi:DnaJ-domain-containing protein 1